MRTYGGITVLVLALFLTPSLCEASSKLDWLPYDPDTGAVFNSHRILIEDGGSYEVPRDAMGTGRIEIDHPDWVSPYTRGNGELFYIPNPDDPDTRVLIGETRDFSWPEEGTYELDSYAVMVAPSAVPKSRFFSWLIPTAHAAPAGDYVDTIRFTISIGAPLGDPCCSSVLFIPGMQGSALELGDDQVWPPTVWSDDVPQLAVTRDGESVNPITIGGVIEDFYNVPVYSGFLAYLDELTSDSESGVASWRALPYDWRLPLSKVINEGVTTYDGQQDIFDTIYNLAGESNTGKVTIVGHSMGGLLGKMIVQELVARGEENLIDAFIMVGTPQLGTPQGAAAMLHGHDQGIPGGYPLPGVIVDPAEAREVAQNMASAFTLMPSARYFGEVSSPVVTFSTSSPFTQAWRSHWGPTLNTYSKFKEFVIGNGVPRTNPTTNLAIPEVLDASLMQDTEDLHTQLDNFTFPDSIRVVQIAGWGLPTVKTIDYRNEHNTQNFEVAFTKEGDGTVVYPSAVASLGETYYLNLDTFRTADNQQMQHRDLLSANSIQKLISQILRKNSGDISDISTVKPEIASLDQQLLVSTHSPITLKATDTSGRVTGIDSSAGNSSGFLLIEQEIPGSIFISFGGDQYLFLPRSGSYDIRVQGTASGPATIETSTFTRDTVTRSAAYSDIPVTAQTVAEIELESATPQNASVQVDTNGDGQIDTIVTPDNYAPTIGELFVELKARIGELKSKNKVVEKLIKTILIKKVEQLEKKILKVKSKRASKQLVILSKQITWIGTRTKLIEGDVNAILDLLNQIEKQL